MGPELFFSSPANPDLTDILGDTDFGFDIFFDFCWIPDFQVPRFPDSQISGCQPEIARAFAATAPPWLRGAPGPQSAGDPRN